MELVAGIVLILLALLAPMIAGGFLAARLSKRDPRRERKPE